MNMTTATEADLLGLMTSQQSGAEQARSAWEELFVRHRRYVYVVLSRSYGSFLGEDGTVDLVVDTFRRAYEWAGRQQSAEEVREQFSTDTPDATRRKVLGWLGAIAERLFKDRFRTHAIESARHDEFLEDWKLRRDEPDDPSDSSAVERLREALATLSAADADALRLSLPWYDPGTRAFVVPRGEAARLADLLGISPETLRQRRHRALKKLEHHLQASAITESIEEEPQ